MRQSSRIISTYAADVSGVCSALFEYGGMTVMHDASGCNSTYNTHDEPRWYDMDSMVFISALTETEAILGDDEKLLSDIVDAASETVGPQTLRDNQIDVLIATTIIESGLDIPSVNTMIVEEAEDFGLSHRRGPQRLGRKVDSGACIRQYGRSSTPG